VLVKPVEPAFSPRSLSFGAIVQVTLMANILSSLLTLEIFPVNMPCQHSDNCAKPIKELMKVIAGLNALLILSRGCFEHDALSQCES